MQDLLDLELSDRLQVCPAAAGLGDNLSLFVREEAHCLGAACVDAEHVD